jgi:hypothetical protein
VTPFYALLALIGGIVIGVFVPHPYPLVIAAVCVNPEPIEAPRLGDARPRAWAWLDPWKGDHEILTPRGWLPSWKEDGPVNGLRLRWVLNPRTGGYYPSACNYSEGGELL